MRSKRKEAPDLLFPLCVVVGAAAIGVVGVSIGYEFAKADFLAVNQSIGSGSYEPPPWRKWMVHEPIIYSAEEAAYDACSELKERFGVNASGARFSDGTRVPTTC